MSAIEKIYTAVLKSRLFPNWIRLFTVCFFLPVVVGLLFGPPDRNNPFNLLVWLIWWPSICIMFLFAGRVWCSLCPFSLLSDWVRRVAGLQLPVPDFLKQNGAWLILITFFLLSWMEEVTGSAVSPRSTSIVLLIILSGALIFGLFFRGHAWCRYVCPLGGVSLVYARTSLLKVRANEVACAECLTKDCVVVDSEYSGCPMLMTPFAMDTVANCKSCGTCVKRCANDSLHVAFEAPSKDLSITSTMTEATAWLIVFLAGLLSFLNTMKSGRLPIEAWVAHLAHPYFIKTLLLAVAFAISFVLFKMLLSLAARSNLNNQQHRLLTIGSLPMVPLLLLTHLAYLSSRFWEYGGELLAPFAAYLNAPWLKMDFLWGAPWTKYISPFIIGTGLLITLGVLRWSLVQMSGLPTRRLASLFGLFYFLFAGWNIFAVWPISNLAHDITNNSSLFIDNRDGWTILWPFVSIIMALLILALVVGHFTKTVSSDLQDDFSATRAWVIRGVLNIKQVELELLDWLLEQATQARWRIPEIISLANASQEIITFLQRTLPEGSPVNVKAILRKNKGLITISHEGRPLTLPDYKATPSLDSIEDIDMDGIELRLAAAQVEHMSYQARLSELHCSFTLRQSC